MYLEKSSKQGQPVPTKKNACKDRKQRLEITFNTSLNEDKVTAEMWEEEEETDAAEHPEIALSALPPPSS